MGLIADNIKKAFDIYSKTGNLSDLCKKLVFDADYSVRYSWQLGEWRDAFIGLCPDTVYECLWYNGTSGNYELLDFNPNGLSVEAVIAKAWKILSDIYQFDESDKDKVLETLYLMPTHSLISIKG